MEFLIDAGYVLIVLILVFSGMHSYYAWKLGVPTSTTSPAVRDKMISFIPQQPCNIMELGSGFGDLALAAAKARPDCTVTAVEYAIFPLLVSKLRLALSPELKNLTFARRDFFALSLKDTNVILCYLLEPVLEKLRPKLEAELPAGALLISNHYKMPGWEPEKSEETGQYFEKKVHVYKKSGVSS